MRVASIYRAQCKSTYQRSALTFNWLKVTLEERLSYNGIKEQAAVFLGKCDVILM